MRAPSTQILLDIWETGRALPPSRRAVALLSAAMPQTPAEELATLSIGRRDGLMLELRRLLFGPRVQAVAACPKCREELQSEFGVKDVLRAGPEYPDSDLTVSWQDQQCRLRLPCGDDTDAIAGITDVPTAARRLLERCVLSATRGGEPATIDDLADELITAAGQKLAEADPQADIQLLLRCPSCEHQWASPFDVVSFLWIELDGWAHRALHDVHVLASKYGWREADILEMTPLRRQMYIDMVDG